MSVVRLAFIITTAFGGLMSFALVWTGMEMLGLPGWTAIAAVVGTVWLTVWWLERLTRPRKTPMHHESPISFQRPRQPRKTSLD